MSEPYFHDIETGIGSDIKTAEICHFSTIQSERLYHDGQTW